jgi:subtilisin family serine protease
MRHAAIVAVVLALCASRAIASEPLAAYPGRLVVKYRPTVDICATCTTPGGRTRGSVRGSARLDRLHEELGVDRVRPLFGPWRGAGGGRAGTFADALDWARHRFPARAARSRGTPAPDLSRFAVLELPATSDLAAAAATLAADPDVASVELDHLRRATLLPNDPFLHSTGTWGQSYPDLWGMLLTDAPTAWNTAIGAGVVVAIIDTGVDRGHADLATNMWTNPGETPGNGLDDDGNGFIDDVLGWDFRDDDADPKDQHGHGTHVAGTAAGLGNDGFGIAGMAWGARIMAVRGLGSDGFGYDSELAEAIVYAAANGADVLNASWGGVGTSTVLHDAVQTARSLGAVVVAAAGNDGGNADVHFPSAFPEVIAVGATRFDDTIASFSNFGTVLSVSAPGVDVLSARGASSGPVGGQAVGASHLRLSGTSMATPHVAGLAAVLLSAMPGLTADEVRWHLELNADQPGAPGFEGSPWNPFFGFGRIDAGRVFDPPPVTTRVRPGSVSVHALQDLVLPDALTATFDFTTLAPVPWTLHPPAWLGPDVAAGTGPAAVSFTLDTTGLPIGTVSDAVVVDAPATADGGATIGATVVVHRNESIGDAVGFPDGETTFGGEPAVASNGIGSVVVYGHRTLPDPPQLRSAYIDPTGAVTVTFVLDEGFPFKHGARIAGDGRGYLVVWDSTDTSTVHGKTTGTDSVLAMRLGARGEPLDGAPIVVATSKYRDCCALVWHHVAFDGASWILTWADLNSERDVSSAFFKRMGRDGSQSRRRAAKLYPNRGTTQPQTVDPHVACVSGQCLVAYHEADGELNALGKFVDKINGVRIAGNELVDRASFQIMRDAESIRDLTATGDGYVVLADRTNICPGPVRCGDDAIAARVSTGGTALDPDGVRLNVPPPGGTEMLVQQATFDGTSLVGTFLEFGGPAGGGQIFAGRMAPDGTVPDDEPEGLLLHAAGSAVTSGQSVDIASTRTHSVLAWANLPVDPEVQQLAEVRVQRTLAHAPAALPGRAIGSIGTLAAAEHETVAFALTAPGLAPATTTFSAIGMPPGAELDPRTGAFQWIPAADERGSHPPVRFAATDGTASVSEDVAVVVSEAVGAAGGVARLQGGGTVPGAVFRISGTPGGPRLGQTDASGRFRFEGLAPGRYRLRLDKPTRKAFRATPPAAIVEIGSSDVLDVDFLLTPR